MKLIIDIPEKAYKLRLTNPVWYDSNMDKAIRNGVPLEELKKDIEEIDIKEDVYKLPDFKCCEKRDKSAKEIKEQILKRIDKYIKEAL